MKCHRTEEKKIHAFKEKQTLDPLIFTTFLVALLITGLYTVSPRARTNALEHAQDLPTTPTCQVKIYRLCLLSDCCCLYRALHGEILSS